MSQSSPRAPATPTVLQSPSAEVLGTTALGAVGTGAAPTSRPVVWGDTLCAMSDDVEHQQALNRGTWAALQDAGVNPGDPLTIDAFFFAPDEASSVALSTDLQRDGWDAETRSQKAGLLRRRTSWSVEATRRIASVDLPELDGMVEVLVRRAREHRAEFDGWGAEAPGEGDGHG